MPDRYQQLVTSPLGRQVADVLSLPVPEDLRRHQPGQPLIDGLALVGEAKGGRLLDAALAVLDAGGADVRRTVDDSANASPGAHQAGPYGALVFDASGIDDSSRLRELYEFFHAAIRKTGPSARLIVLAGATDEGDARRRTAQRAIEGFTRSLGKELRQGATCNLVRIAEGAEDRAESTLEFLLSARSAFVAGQAITLRPGEEPVAEVEDAATPHTGRVALVTGAAQGIGASMAAVLARDGAHVICADIPAQGEALARVANHVGGSTLHLDVTADTAPAALVEHLRERHGGIDVVVHNAGITRDKTLAGMDDARWDSVLAVNLSSQERLDEALLEADLLRSHGRIIGVSSIGGIAGNRGQTNYGTSKAGVIGRVEALADELAGRQGTINAVAPGFIETAMTARMPIGVREAGRRMSSLGQGGRPVDVAETVSWLADARSGAVNGQVVRVCGQSLLGA